FAARYPNDVAGEVLVECSLAGSFGRHTRPGWLRWSGAGVALAPWAARLGIVRAIVALVPTDVDLLPPRERAEQKAFLSCAKTWDGVHAEWESWWTRTTPEAGAAAPLGARPLAI